MFRRTDLGDLPGLRAQALGFKVLYAVGPWGLRGKGSRDPAPLSGEGMGATLFDLFLP